VSLGVFREQIDAISTDFGAAIILFVHSRAIGSFFSPATAQHGETGWAVDGQWSGSIRRQGV